MSSSVFFKVDDWVDDADADEQVYAAGHINLPFETLMNISYDAVDLIKLREEQIWFLWSWLLLGFWRRKWLRLEIWLFYNYSLVFSRAISWCLGPFFSSDVSVFWWSFGLLVFPGHLVIRLPLWMELERSRSPVLLPSLPERKLINKNRNINAIKHFRHLSCDRDGCGELVMTVVWRWQW